MATLLALAVVVGIPVGIFCLVAIVTREERHIQREAMRFELKERQLQLEIAKDKLLDRQLERAKDDK